MKKLILKLDNMYMKFIIFILLFTGLAFISFNVDQNIQLSVLSEVLSFSQRFTETLAIMIHWSNHYNHYDYIFVHPCCYDFI